MSHTRLDMILFPNLVCVPHHAHCSTLSTFQVNQKDSLVRIQIFVKYLGNFWYDAAGFIIPQSVVWALMQDEEEQEEEEKKGGIWHEGAVGV